MNGDPASLDRLHDIVEPPPVPWWPPAPGEYLVLALVGVALLWWAVRAWHAWRANAYRRRALKELAAIESALQERKTGALTALPILLKCTALAAFPRERVASLSETAWFEFLNKTAGAALFDTGVSQTLATLSYRPEATVRLDGTQMTAAVSAIRNWIRRHRRRED